ncbi:Subtilisin-like protease SBT5.3 [Carex littledalei]|uniref:Subtilisin-like protease SBT5.3 n=1 Tax=Carex littledalei TaxID=544730 RepID=A0A833Q8X5_9POAL|nr:Subtilisin-like protease SBT5.3 [Carex littledalei]
MVKTLLLEILIQVPVTILFPFLGVWPESESFADDGMDGVPSDWNGICQNELDISFTCNKKLIGARYFNKGYEAYEGAPLNISFQTPRDTDGHGTHTLSTAGGTFVANASFFGYGNGTAKGGSPHARVAAYKGLSLSSTSLAKGKYPIIMSTDAKTANSTENDARLCLYGSLDSAKVNGSIVICARGTNARVEKGEVVLEAGGVGMVLINPATASNNIIPDKHILPAVAMTYSDSQTLLCHTSNQTGLYISHELNAVRFYLVL